MRKITFGTIHFVVTANEEVAKAREAFEKYAIMYRDWEYSEDIIRTKWADFMTNWIKQNTN